MTQPIIEVVTEAGDWSSIPGAEGCVRRAAQATLAAAGMRLFAGAEVSVMLTDDAAIRELNRDWREMDKPTNVLSFPAVPPDRVAGAPILGDVVVALETLQREAREEGKPPADHLAHLVVHGVLHLLGYDHEAAPEAEAMEALEVAVLAGLGIPDPYAGSELDAPRAAGTMARES